jgi:aspartate/methionine/tyrosine aminotransferase
MFASRTNWPLERNRFSLALENHRRTGAKLFDLTASNPTTCGFAYPEQEILAALADPRALTYRPESKGLREAREAVANYYHGRAGFTSPESHRVDTSPVRRGRGEDASPVRAESADANLAHAASVAVKTIDPENIVLTSGTSEGYSYIFRLLCDPGDEILVPAPSYPLFEFLADLADVRLVPYPLLYDHGWQIDFEALRAALTPRARAVLVVHPNNPTGSFVKTREAAELAEMCATRGMAIVADEVFLDYPVVNRRAGGRTSHEHTGAERTAADRTAGEPTTGEPTAGDRTAGEPAAAGADRTSQEHTGAERTVGEADGVKPRTFACGSAVDRAAGNRTAGDGTAGDRADGAAARTFAFGSAALTFTLSGISKICALPQMKLAWIVAGGPQHLVAAAMERLEIIADTFLSPGAPAQVALPRFLEMRGGLQAQLQQRVAANLGYLDALLQGGPGPLERLAREGGWYAVLRIPSSRSDEEYAVELLERCAVLAHPGQFFNFSQEGFLVLSLIAPEDEFQEGARRLHKFFAA